jgi:hydroxyacyl-ACP dehydratase HTD2-like protein with hotdog domain
MLDFGGSVYHLDVEKFTTIIKMEHPNGVDITETITKEIKDEKGKTITSEVITTKKERDMYIQQTMYELLREMIDIVLNDADEMDEELGSERALDKMSISYKIAFNTLIHYGILIEVV